MRKGLQRTIATLLIMVGLYSLVGFLILPGLALRIINQQLAHYVNVPARLERLELNPFSLKLDLYRLHLGEADAEQLAFEYLHGNLQWDSLWSGALHLAALDLERPELEVRFDPAGQLNLLGLLNLPQTTTEQPQKETGKPFPVRLDRFRLTRGRLHFQDLRPDEPVDLHYDSIAFELSNLSTLPSESADLNLQATSPHGGRIDWSGRISLTPLASSGRLGIDQLGLQALWPYVRQALPLALNEGSLSLHTEYQLNLAEQLQLELHNASLSLTPLALQAPDGRPLARLQSLEVGNATIDLGKRQVVIGQLQSQGLEAWAARESDGTVDWQKLLSSTQPPPAETAPAAPPPTTDSTPPAAPWQVLLQDVQMRGTLLHLADRVPKETVKLDIGPLDLYLLDLDSLGHSPFQLKLDTAIGKGRVQIAGQAQQTPLSAHLKVDTRDLDLRLAQAYLSPFLRLELRSGRLDSALQLELKDGSPMALDVGGRVVVKQLHTLDTLKNRDFVKWQQLALDGLNYHHGKSLSIDQITLDQPYARFIISEDLTTNAGELLVASPRSESTGPSTGRKTPKTSEEPLGIHIGAIDIRNGSANFADFSLRPNFATAIQQLNGHIGTLDNRKQAPASVDIKGKVDRYAPVTIKGSLTPFNPLERLDIATRFQRVELTTLTPYSGKFAGYRIRKGRLNLDLHYRIQNGHLNAENKMVLEQLQLGERVDSPDAVDLPIRLAVALLKDTQGRIAIDLPVRGDLNNPQFSVMPIVWKTLRNLVLRAVEAPFKFVAGLTHLGHDDSNLDRVDFLPGSSELDPKAQRNLDTLSAGLKQRPQLRLEVEGMSSQASDGPLLAEQRLEREYRSMYYRILQRQGERVPTNAEQLEVPPKAKPPLLEGIYRSRLRQQPPAEWAKLKREQRAELMRQALLDFWSDSTLLLRRLAQARAATIKNYLVEHGGLSDQRIYQLDVGVIESPADDKVSVPLHLDSE